MNFKCDDIDINKSCDQLFIAIDKSVITVDFSTISLDTTDLQYSYTFLLEVYDDALLLYQFVYDSNKYHHPNLLSTPYIDKVL